MILFFSLSQIMQRLMVYKLGEESKVGRVEGNGKRIVFTCPFEVCLLLSLTLANDTDSFIQCAPKLGDSGCTYTGFWGGSSALPPGTQSPFTYFHLQCFQILVLCSIRYEYLRLHPKSQILPYLCCSICTNSKSSVYMAAGSNPCTDTFTTGNIRLENEKYAKSQMLEVTAIKYTFSMKRAQTLERVSLIRLGYFRNYDEFALRCTLSLSLRKVLCTLIGIVLAHTEANPLTDTIIMASVYFKKTS